MGERKEMDKLAILYTTFMRPELCEQTTQSILDNWVDGYTLFRGFQEKKPFDYDVELHGNKIVRNYHQPFDCGLSAARNDLVKRAADRGFKYCLLTADSIAFTDRYNYQPVIDFLESDPKNGIVGIDLSNRKGDWNRDLELIPGKHFYLKFPTRAPIEFQGMTFQPLDIVKNFFIAKIECLLDVPWDEELALSEHECEFYRIQQRGWKVFFTTDIAGEYIQNRPEEYNRYRKRMYSYYRKKKKKKYGISGWVVLEK